jgi:DNA-binding PadR family transcriptional regulator
MTTLNPTYDAVWGARPWRRRSAGPAPWRAVFAARHRGGGPRGVGGFGFGGQGFGFGGPGFGFGGAGFGPGPRGPFGRGGRRARRGDVRLAALLLLAEEPRNGYALMQELEQRSGGLWRPSPGSVYPALAQLEDEGLIRSREQNGGRVFELTDAGRAQVAERPEDAPAPWDAVGQAVPEEALALFGQLRQLGAAVMQVAQAGNTAQAQRAADVLDDARRSVYRILADGEGGEA